MNLPWCSLLQLARIAPLSVLVVGCGIKKPLSPTVDAAAAIDATVEASSDGEPDAPGDTVAPFDATVEDDAVVDADSDAAGDAGSDADGDAVVDADSDAGVDAGFDMGVMPPVCPPPTSTACVFPAPSFAAEIVPILDARCNTCHDATIPDAPWPLHDLADIVDWKGAFVVSLLKCMMPPPDSPAVLPEAERQRILAWVACDFPDN